MLKCLFTLASLVVLISTVAIARADDGPAAGLRFGDLDTWSSLEPRRDAGFTLGQRLDLGFVDLGVRVGPRHALLAPPPDAVSSAASRYRLGETELAASTDVGVDLRLRWPSWAGSREPALGALQPFLSLGPAISRTPGQELLPASSVTARRDEAMSLGVRGGIGLTWHLAPDASLFGEYQMTQERPFTGRDSGQRGVDLLYGLSVRF